MKETKIMSWQRRRQASKSIQLVYLICTRWNDRLGKNLKTGISLQAEHLMNSIEKWVLKRGKKGAYRALHTVMVEITTHKWSWLFIKDCRSWSCCWSWILLEGRMECSGWEPCVGLLDWRHHYLQHCFCAGSAWSLESLPGIENP